MRTRTTLLGLCIALAAGLMSPAAVQAQWVTPRTPDGHPDLQGNWTNATITPIQRPQGQEPVLTPQQIAEIEGRREELIAVSAADSDPDRPAPAVGGTFWGDIVLDAASGGTGGYNYFWIDGGDRVAIYNGEPRSSLVTTPENGRRPPLTTEAQQRQRERGRLGREFGQFDNPENRPLAERCLMSFGSNAGPPMTPNYFYNNNYTIVQTPDHVMIMTEMVHDTRIIRLGARRPLPAHVRPWMGDSWGRWEGDVLVVETTNIHPSQTFENMPATADLKVIERFARVDEYTINYEFIIDDPTTYTQRWGGEIPYKRQVGQVYEYSCHEGNYALANVLSGARAEEREGARD